MTTLDHSPTAPAMLPRRPLSAVLGVTSVPRAELRERYTLAHSKFVNVMGTDIHYVDEGDGDPIVMIHGFASSLHTWNAVASDLSRAHRVIRMDMPPFGVTGPVRDASGAIRTMDLPACREFIDGFLAALGIERASFIGNSLGGLISWDYALRHPGAVERLVLIDSAGFPMKLPIYIGLFNHALVRATSPFWLPEPIIRAAVRNVYGEPRKLDAVTMRRYVEFFHGEGTREAIGKMVPTLDFAHIDTEALKSLDVPTLVLWGAKDRWISPQHAAEFSSRIPGAQYVMYPGLGHIPMEEAPQRILADLRGFFARKPAHDVSRAIV